MGQKIIKVFAAIMIVAIVVGIGGLIIGFAFNVAGAIPVGIVSLGIAYILKKMLTSILGRASERGKVVEAEERLRKSGWTEEQIADARSKVKSQITADEYLIGGSPFRKKKTLTQARNELARLYTQAGRAEQDGDFARAGQLKGDIAALESQLRQTGA